MVWIVHFSCQRFDSLPGFNNNQGKGNYMQQSVRYLLICLLLIAWSLPGHAKRKMPTRDPGQNYGMAGCGLGSLIFDNPKDYNVKWKQIFASVVDNYIGGKPFTITTGSMNCSHEIQEEEAETEDEAANRFLDQNWDFIKAEAAQGGGDTLMAYTQLLRCTSDNLAGQLQEKMDPIFSQHADEQSQKAKFHETARQACRS